MFVCMWVLFLLFVLQVASSPPSSVWSVAAVDSEFIVSFKAYFLPDRRAALLQQMLESFDANIWSEIPRNNAAFALPSDFVLVRVHNCTNEVLHALRSRVDVVRSVTPHLSLQAVLQNTKKKRKNKNIRSLSAASAAGGASSSSSSSFSGKIIPVASRLHAPYLWTRGVTGAKVRVAIFDTGLGQRGTPFLNNVVEQRDWTSDKSIEDGVGHGSFVASMVAGTNPQCMGLAPDSELVFFRVFTSRRVSFTAWFLDAFNYAIHTKVDVLNLSIGGPDFMDKPFTEKVCDLDD